MMLHALLVIVGLSFAAAAATVAWLALGRRRWSLRRPKVTPRTRPERRSAEIGIVHAR